MATSQKVTNNNATRPLDVVVMLDASGSMSPANWKMEVEFARRVVVALADSFHARNGTFRAALGQFSTSASIQIGMTPHIDDAFANLRTWQCEEQGVNKWEDLCVDEEAKRNCSDDPTCIVRRIGFTEIGAALCGPRDPLDGSCRGELLVRCRPGRSILSHGPDSGNRPR